MQVHAPINAEISAAIRSGAAITLPAPSHESGSEHGGWDLFGRLLLWATRNCPAAKAEQARRAKAGMVPADADH